VNDGTTYLKETAPAAEGLFKLLNKYGRQKMRALADRFNSKMQEEFN
jgi:hypothetical protein